MLIVVQIRAKIHPWNSLEAANQDPTLEVILKLSLEYILGYLKGLLEIPSQTLSSKASCR